MIERREFLRGAAAATLMARVGFAEPQASSAPQFRTANAPWQRAYDAALALLAANVQKLPHFAGPVLIEGAEYAGVWQECGPQEGLVYAPWNAQAAVNNHLTFFDLQREDGQMPANNKRSETGFGQIQMVVPIAATAWELAQLTGDEAFLAKAYSACSRWDEWLVKYRNTRGTGLVEGFCTYDTGHDNSPRWRGVANQCPGKDAKRFVPGQGTPRLCPDLSATVYGGRMALAEMAQALGKDSESRQWSDKAKTLRKLILDKLYVPEDGAFYDLDADDNFVRVRGDVISRVCGEGVPDARQFEDIWKKQLHNSAAFWTPYPLPSIALDDPAFVRPIPRNSWGGASQALTALRAPRWMEHYGKHVALGEMMEAWSKALVADGTFRQQMDPVTGVFSGGGSAGYSPAALVLLDFTWRLAGISERSGVVAYNVRPGCAAAAGARFTRTTRDGRVAEMRYRERGAEIWLGGRHLFTIEGTVRCDIVSDAPVIFRPPPIGPDFALGPGRSIVSLTNLIEGEQTVTVKRTGGIGKKIRLVTSHQLPGVIQ